MMRCKITKIKSTNTNLRTDEVEGYCVNPPRVGAPFVLYAEPLESVVGVRWVATSVVTEVRADSFKTLNSEYLFSEIVG